MNSSVIQSILKNQGISYLITNQQWVLTEAGGAIDILKIDNQRVELDDFLLDLIPELIGCEDILKNILIGKTPRFELPKINRTNPAGETIYLSMMTLPHRDQNGKITGLIHIAEDVTKTAQQTQLFIQQRNENRLEQGCNNLKWSIMLQ